MIFLFGALPLSDAASAPSQKTFTLGSTSREVARVQGAPTSIDRDTVVGKELWHYGHSQVTFSTETDRVIEWRNEGNLEVSLEPGSRTTTAPFFTKGSHKDDVLRIQGTPTAIERDPAQGKEDWSFGLSSVTFSSSTDRVIAWDDGGNLKVGLGPAGTTTDEKCPAGYAEGSSRGACVPETGTPAKAIPNAIVRRAQGLLSDLGYQPGPVDGILGTRTRHAAIEFQTDNRRPATGVVDEKLLALLETAVLQHPLTSREPVPGAPSAISPTAQRLPDLPAPTPGREPVPGFATGASPDISPAPGSQPGERPSFATEPWPTLYGLTVTGLVLAVILAGTIGLLPPVLIRHAILKRPLRRWSAIAICAGFWVVNLVIFEALGSRSARHAAVALIAIVSYYILRRGARRALQPAAQGES